MSVKERIVQYLDKKGISQTKAEQMLGWGKGALIKAKSISVDKMGEFLLLFDDLSAEWVLRGIGEMIKSSSSTNAGFPTIELLDELKAEINRLKGENSVLREQIGLGERRDSSKSLSRTIENLSKR